MRCERKWGIRDDESFWPEQVVPFIGKRNSGGGKMRKAGKSRILFQICSFKMPVRHPDEHVK